MQCNGVLGMMLYGLSLTACDGTVIVSIYHRQHTLGHAHQLVSQTRSLFCSGGCKRVHTPNTILLHVGDAILTSVVEMGGLV